MSENDNNENAPEQKPDEKIDVAYLGQSDEVKRKIAETQRKLNEMKPGQRGIIDPKFKPITSESLLRKATAASEEPEWKKGGKWLPRRLPQFGWRCGDAYKMYKYQDEATGLVEWIWNSRDGVVPFIIRGMDGGSIKHVDFWEDVYLPNWVPPLGTRIFTDIPDFDEKKHQFNVRPVVVDITLHNMFKQQASFTPWRPDMKPRGFA